MVGCLIQSLGDEEREVRERALEAISSLAEKGIITRDDEGTRRRRRELVPHMKHENWEIRRVAISASKVLFPNNPIDVDSRGLVSCDEELSNISDTFTALWIHLKQKI